MTCIEFAWNGTSGAAYRIHCDPIRQKTKKERLEQQRREYWTDLVKLLNNMDRLEIEIAGLGEVKP